MELTRCQKNAIKILERSSNVFLTGAAGTGKSTLLNEYLRDKNPKTHPILASTGSAAVIIGGRTFHSFFGLGIMQGGYQRTVESALKNKRVVNRIKKTVVVIIDEVSMLSGVTLSAAEEISRRARESDLPWGGLRIVAVGDFAQLPPVSRNTNERDWAFLNDVWEMSEFAPAVLKTFVRSKDKAFLEILDDIRHGAATHKVVEYLNSRIPHPSVEKNFKGTRLFPHRKTTEAFNLQKLHRLPGTTRYYETQYLGDKKHFEKLKSLSPVPETLQLKENALVMIRQNDPRGRWVNGSLGNILDLNDEEIGIRLLEGPIIKLEKTSFSLLDAEGEPVAAATNFPLNLAYATTIHKSQGLTIDQVWVELRNLWEPGQAYVALSRARTSKSVFVSSWNPRSIQIDPMVERFYEELELYH